MLGEAATSVACKEEGCIFAVLKEASSLAFALQDPSWSFDAKENVAT